ncbi:MAG: mandelate racemase/muconate lactonizing enzyme family protein [Tropicimonas sp.]|uniref:mandelate racemase/muconate lactonizing enzyme family protein n=1 Tax=Tropicimonas sp. TaxID=2067044 RepID=UPI003A88E1E7
MKITKVEIFECDITRGTDEITKFTPILMRVHTDEGITGIGEAGLAYGNSAKAAVGQLCDFAPLIIGRDPMKVESIWEDLFRGTFWGMSGGPVVYSGMSAIDIACWDIRGKALNAPIHVLLGGKTNDDLRTYASQIQFDWSDRFVALFHPEEYAAAARKAMDDGYDAVKVDPVMIFQDGNKMPPPAGVPHRYFGILEHRDVKMAVDRIAAIRDEVGPDVDIIVEIHSYLGVNAAIQLGRALEDFGVFYYEEPVHPMNVDNMALIAERTKLPVATGERSYTRWGYRSLFEKQALAVIQPDLCLAGGITEGKKICDYANIYDTTVQIHVCGAPVSTAAALQVEAVIPNFIIHEHHTWALKKSLRELCVHDYQPVGGKYEIPELPGLGQELNDEVVGKYLAHTIT